MRIALITVGSRGDVQPFVALGRRLVAAGHEVRLATNRLFEDEARRQGFEFVPVRDFILELLETPEGRAWCESGTATTRLARSMFRMIEPFIEEALDDFATASRGVDLVMGSLHTFLGAQIAATCGARFCAVHFAPTLPTSEFTHPMAADVPLGRTYRRLSWVLNGLATAAGVLSLELTKTPVVSKVWRWKRRNVSAAGETGLVLAAFSEHVVPRPHDWPSHARLTGYWWLEDDAVPPPDAVDFVERGVPPVCIGFGSMVGADPVGLTRIVLDALARSRRRAVLLTGWGGLDRELIEKSALDVYVAKALPHAWLYPRASAIFHHGGAGTTGAAVRAGTPNGAVPFIGDQLFWGRRVAALGVGPPPLPKTTLSAGALASAIERATTDVAMRRRAAELGALVSAEDGLGNAVRAIEDFIG